MCLLWGSAGLQGWAAPAGLWLGQDTSWHLSDTSEAAQSLRLTSLKQRDRQAEDCRLCSKQVSRPLCNWCLARVEHIPRQSPQEQPSPSMLLAQCPFPGTELSPAV